MGSSSEFSQGLRKDVLLLLIVYLVGIAIAEALVAYVDFTCGLVLHCLLIATLVISAAVFSVKLPDLSKLLVAILLAPLIRVLSLATPFWSFISTLYWLLIITFPLLAAAFSTFYANGLSRADVGLVLGSPKKISFQVGIGLVGIPLGFVEYLILKPEAWIPSLAWQNLIVAAFILLIGTGFAEEFIFRGIMLHNAESVLGGRGALLYVSLIFASLHIGYLSILDLMFVFAIAIFFGLIVQRTRTILGVVLCHGLLNIALYLIVPFYL